jgi:hypothetical protein
VLVEVGEQGGDISGAVPDMQHVNPLPNVAVENQIIAVPVNRQHTDVRKSRIGRSVEMTHIRCGFEKVERILVGFIGNCSPG